MKKVALPGWSRLRFVFGAKVKSASLSILLLGSFIRLEGNLPFEWSYLLDNNGIADFLTCGKWSVSSMELLYLSSVIYVFSYFIYTKALPRDIEVTKIRSDYVTRSKKNINEKNVLEWIEKYWAQVRSGELRLEDDDRETVKRYRDYCVSNAEVENAVKIDRDIKVTIIHLLQIRYAYLDKEYRKKARGLVYALLIFSGLLGAAGSAESMFISIYNAL